jgi:hypothetical protein
VITHTHKKRNFRKIRKKKQKLFPCSLLTPTQQKKNPRPIIPKPDANPKKEPKTKFTNSGHHSQHNSLSLIAIKKTKYHPHKPIISKASPLHLQSTPA